MKPNDKAFEAVLAERDALKAERDADRAHRVLAAELHAAAMSTQRDIAIRERDALKAELAAANKRAANRLAVEAERDAALAKIDAISSAIKSPRYMDPPDGGSVTIAEQVARMWEDNEALRSERDALLARLAPVDDEALETIAARAIVKENVYKETQIPSKTLARAAIAAIRPHIEAAERERCAKIADKYEGEWHSDPAEDACARAIAAAIRSGK